MVGRLASRADERERGIFHPSLEYLAGASPIVAKTLRDGSVGVSPAFSTKRAGCPRSFGLQLSEMRPYLADWKRAG